MSKYTYHIKPFQVRIINEIQTLKPNIFNYVIQQSLFEPNLTLPQLKRSIYRSVRFLVKDILGNDYRIGVENELINYYCFFETTKEFNLALNDINTSKDLGKMGLHFHLFISSSDPKINLTRYIHYLSKELTSFPLKRTSISKLDYKVYTTLEQDFILYHTKQYKDYTKELIYKNF